MSFPPARRLLLCLFALIAAIAIPSVSQASKPQKGATYKGKATGATDSRDRSVRLKVSGSGRGLSFRGPHERCGGFNPLKPFFGAIDTVRISRTGKFKAKRENIVRLKGARGGDTGPLDIVLDWSIEVSGHFTSSRRAEGKITYNMRHHLEDSDEPGKPWDPPGPDGPTEKNCGKRSGSWKAKRG